MNITQNAKFTSQSRADVVRRVTEIAYVQSVEGNWTLRSACAGRWNQSRKRP